MSKSAIKLNFTSINATSTTGGTSLFTNISPANTINFKSLSGGTNISLSETDGIIVISGAAGGSSSGIQHPDPIRNNELVNSFTDGGGNKAIQPSGIQPQNGGFIFRNYNIGGGLDSSFKVLANSSGTNLAGNSVNLGNINALDYGVSQVRRGITKCKLQILIAMETLSDSVILDVEFAFSFDIQTGTQTNYNMSILGSIDVVNHTNKPATVNIIESGDALNNLSLTVTGLVNNVEPRQTRVYREDTVLTIPVEQ